MILYALALLAGLVLGLTATVRVLIFSLALLACAVMAGSILAGQGLGAGALHTIVMLALFQAGYFGAVLVRAMSGADMVDEDSAPGKAADALPRPHERNAGADRPRERTPDDEGRPRRREGAGGQSSTKR
ncbi:MAG: hypothetical protein AB7O39_12805 [Flavobacteriaceae bacterium]